MKFAHHGFQSLAISCVLVVACSLLPPSVADVGAVTFNRYRVPDSISVRAGRDIEFWWSQSYADNGHPLVPGGPGLNDLDRFALTLCDVPSNPFGFSYPDWQLVYDYLNVPYTGRDTLYNPADSVGFLIASSSASISNRKHIDFYIYAPKTATFAGDYPPNYGMSPSYFTAPDEDLSTGLDSAHVFHTNSLMIAGPPFSGVGDTSATAWWRPNLPANVGAVHEFQHAFNNQAGGQPMTEILSSAAEALGGGTYGTPKFDVNYNLSVLDQNYEGWELLTPYLAYNFRGADLTQSGRTDDLLWRWAHRNSSPSMTNLATSLDDAVCAECAAKSYFTGLGSVPRLDVLLHNWRVATYVNNYALAEHQYGYNPAFHFSPDTSLGAWQSNDGVAWDDSMAVPAEFTAVPSWRTQEISTTMHPAGPGYAARKLRLKMFGSEYFVIHASPSLGSGGDTLVVRVSPEAIVKGVENGFTCQVDSSGGRLRVSVVTYSSDADSLFRHPGWATSVTTKYVDVDRISEDLEFVVNQFGTTTKAVVVVATMHPISSGIMGLLFTPPQLPIRFSAALRKSPYQAPNPRQIVATSGAWDDFPSWSPSGAELVFHSKIPSSATYEQIYRVSASGGTPTVVQATSSNQLRPDWSPRGDWVAWEQDSAGLYTDIWMKNVATGEFRRVTWSPGFEVLPVFRPDGQRLAYMSKLPTSSDPWQLRTVNLDGTGDVLVSSLGTGASPLSPRWSMDGQWIYFTRGDSLYAVNANGGAAFYRGILGGKGTEVDLHRGSGPLLMEQPGSQTYQYICRQPVSCGCGDPFGSGTLSWRRTGIRDTVAADTKYRFSATGAQLANPRWSYDGTRVAYSSDQNHFGDRDLFVGQASFDHAPVFTYGSTPDQEIPACAQWARNLSATDADGEALTYKVFYLPPGAYMYSPTQIRWTPGQEQVGDYYLGIRVTDASGGLDYRVIKITVADEGFCDDLCPHCLPPAPPAIVIPKVFELGQNRPNPFHTSTTIQFGLPVPARVSLEILDLQGRVIRQLVAASLRAGYHTAEWDRRDGNGNVLGSGVYFYRLRAKDFVDRKKLILMP